MTIAAALADSATNGPNGGSFVLAVLLAGLVALPVVFFLAALFSVLASPLTGGMKLVWIVFAFCAPFLGPLLWFVVGKRSAYETAR
ncbi:PLD nuclease N-terminal domain-containing protein [Amycolatopsis ultiminotia]